MTKKRKQVTNDNEAAPSVPYFLWNEALNAALIQCMVELAQKHQVENGSFKNGTFNELENMMEEKVPGCGVKVESAIRSRHKKLKKDFHAVQLLHNQSGCGWDDVTKTPTLDDDVFEVLVKVHPNCKNLNKKPFPFYDDLLKVFGKFGPANGKKTQGLTDAVHSPLVDGSIFVDLDGTQSPFQVEGPSVERFMEEMINEGVELSRRAVQCPVSQPTVQPAKGGSDSVMKKRVRKAENKSDDAIAAVAEELCGLKPVISKALDALGTILGEREEDDGKEVALMSAIGKIAGLDRGQVLDAAMALVENDRKTRLFFALDNEEDRKYFIQNLLR